MTTFSLTPRAPLLLVAGLVAVLQVPLRGPAHAQTQPQDPMNRLNILIGSWDVEDVYTPISGPQIREEGVRTCARALLGRYLECVTKAKKANGREREYRWYLTYSSDSKKYELVSLFSNVSFKISQTIRIDATGKVWNIRSQPSSDDDGVEQWTWAQLRFESNDRAVWTSYRNFDTGAPGDWSPSTRETWVRKPGQP